MFHTDRHKLFNRRPIDQIGTQIALKKFPVKHQLLILREIASAFQTKAQQTAWDPQTSGICDWCGTQLDSRFHRMVECEAFQEAREPHVQATKYLQDEGAELCDLPVFHQHPYAEYRQTILDAMPEPSIPEQMVQKLQTGRNKDTLQFYTDGSCQYPHLKHLCFASYSIVVDLLEHDVDRRTLAAAFPFTNSLQSFQQIACGLLHGFQSIHRAELIAIVILCENFEEFTVFTDSADVIHKVDICRQTADSSELAGFTDYDLLLRLHGALKPTKIVLKTKAHREPSQISDLLERYRAMGNATVDCHAKKTCDTLFPEISRELESQCQDVSHDIQELHGVFALILDLQIARARAEEDKRVGQHILDNAGGAQMTKLENRLVNWRIENKWQDQRTWTMRWVQYSACGSQVMKAVEEWLRSCDWPQEEQNVEEDIGMAWAEVAIALTLFHGQWLPVRRDRQGKQFVLQATSEAELELLETNLNEQAKMAYTVVQHFWSLVPEEVMPCHVTNGKVKALYAQGYRSWTTGLQKRPSYPRQSEVYYILANFMQSSNKSLDGLPKINLDTFLRWEVELQRRD